MTRANWRALACGALIAVGMLLTLALVAWLLYWLGAAIALLFHAVAAVHPLLVMPVALCGVSVTLAAAESGAALLGL